MSETTCKWNGSDSPRVISGRHEVDCQGPPCRGCQPCTEHHCRICGHAHSIGTCAECMAETRANLREIGRMCHSLPEEVEHRGVDGEAMMLLGPTANPETWGHVEASVLAGRLGEDWLERADGELHPLFVLGGWEMVWRDALEQPDNERLRLPDAVDYLDRTMALMGGHEHVPFEDFARDLRDCVSRLEAVLHDGEQIDRGVPCMKCGATLQRTWGKTQAGDGWKCPKCAQTSTEDQYRFAVRMDYIQNADWLNAEDMVVRLLSEGYEVKASTVRSWASERGDRPACVRKMLHSERTVYAVEDVIAAAETRKAA